jgi:hypothetical protein
VTLSSSVLSPLPFAVREARPDYFAPQVHYRSLASRILTLLGGFNVVVVTGDPLSSAPMLPTALDAVAAGRHTVISFSCGRELGRHDELRFRRTLSASLTSGGATGEEPGHSALMVFDDTDRLSTRRSRRFLSTSTNTRGLAITGSRRQFSSRVLSSSPVGMAGAPLLASQALNRRPSFASTNLARTKSRHFFALSCPREKERAPLPMKPLLPSPRSREEIQCWSTDSRAACSTL